MEVTLFSLSSSLTAMKHYFSCILSSSLILIETACCKDPACLPYFVWKFPWHTLLISFNSLVGQEYLKQKEGKGRHSHGLCPCEPRAPIGGQFGVETQKCPHVLWLTTHWFRSHGGSRARETSSSSMEHTRAHAFGFLQEDGTHPQPWALSPKRQSQVRDERSPHTLLVPPMSQERGKQHSKPIQTAVPQNHSRDSSSVMLFLIYVVENSFMCLSHLHDVIAVSLSPWVWVLWGAECFTVMIWLIYLNSIKRY